MKHKIKVKTTLSPRNPDSAREIGDDVENGLGKLREIVCDENKWLATMMPRDRTSHRHLDIT
jgi:hypothetical protein